LFRRRLPFRKKIIHHVDDDQDGPSHNQKSSTSVGRNRLSR
jgi:hypothetical protein